MSAESSVTINLTKDEALVLHDMTSDFRDRSDDPAYLLLRDQAERQALWNLACILDKALVEVFNPQYREIVQAAKRNLSQ